MYLPTIAKAGIKKEHAFFLAPSPADSDDASASGVEATTTIPSLVSETTAGGEEITTTATSVAEETTEEEEEDDRKKRRRRKKPKEKCDLSSNIKIFSSLIFWLAARVRIFKLLKGLSHEIDFKNFD